MHLTLAMLADSLGHLFFSFEVFGKRLVSDPTGAQPEDHRMYHDQPTFTGERVGEASMLGRRSIKNHQRNNDRPSGEVRRDGDLI